MEKNNIVINTLVFLENLNSGVEQVKLLQDIHSLGINKVEVRREYIKDFDKELEAIKDTAKKYNMELYYSVPKYLYVDGKLAINEVEEYFSEANKMNCRNVKLNIGTYNSINSENVSDINRLCDKYSVRLTIENDQTEENGRAQKIKDFLESAKRLGAKISCTFDIGNWLWQNEDPKENAYKLKPYVTYIHLKDALLQDKPQAAYLDEGIIPWRDILKIFQEDIPVAIEYPCYPDTLVSLEKEISKLINFN